MATPQAAAEDVQITRQRRRPATRKRGVLVLGLLDSEDLERAGRGVRFGRVDVQHAIAAELLRAIERFVGGLDYPGEAALRAGLSRRGADADGQHLGRCGMRMRNVE